MTFYAVQDGSTGRARRVLPITLPLVEAIADLPHYQPPAPEAPQERRPYGWSPEYRRRLERQQRERQQRGTVPEK
jgi:hypothetical protein